MIFTFEFRGKSYEFDDAKLGLGEARWVKHEINLHGMNFFEAVQSLDPDAVACLVVLAMRRAGETDATMEEISNDDNGYGEFVVTVKVRPSEGDEPKPPPNRATRRRAAAVKDPTP